MTRMGILEGLRKLPAKERLEVVESAIYQLQEDLPLMERPLAPPERTQQLAAAAAALRSDYAEDDELTDFTAFDSQDVYAAG